MKIGRGLTECFFGSILEGVGVHFPDSLNFRSVMALMFIFGMTGSGDKVLKEASSNLYRIAHNKEAVVAVML